MFGLGVQELIIIFLIVFLLFGAKALPDIAKGIANAMKIFKKEINDTTDSIQQESKEDTQDKKEN